MNQMKKSIFTKSIHILIVTLLLLAVFFQREKSQVLMVLTCILWLTVVLGSFLAKHVIKLVGYLAGSIKHLFKTLAEQFPIQEELPEELSAQKAIRSESAAVTSLNDAEQQAMLQHIALRITDKIKSAYQNAVWEWKEAPDLSWILSGKTFRILVENMEKYTHADITFDRFGRIHVEPMTIGSFAQAGTPAQDEEPEPAAEPHVVDVGVWYELIGQKVLDTVITELNANGHSKLCIKENGDIVINRQKKEMIQATLDAFPGKIYWEELISILTENELKGKIAGDHLQVSWI